MSKNDPKDTTYVSENPRVEKTLESHLNAKSVTPEEVQLYIQEMSEKYGVSLKEMIVVASCESGFNVNAFNPHDPNSGSYGVYQYQKATFKMFSEEMGTTTRNIDNWKDQVEVTAYAFSKGYQKHWSCYKMRF